MAIDGSPRKFSPGEKILEKFWRIKFIDYLQDYPVKTDRLEQRRRRGNIPSAALSF
jgi:hypothetical protein